MGRKATDTELATYARRELKLRQMFVQGEREQAEILDLFQNVININPATHRFDRYQQFLVPLEEQLRLLRRLDELVWQDRVNAAGWFDTVDTASNHVQSVEDLLFLWVNFGPLGDNVRLHWRAIAANQQVSSNGGLYLATTPNHLQLHHAARTYQPGIHRVRINLVANWEPQAGRSVNQVRECMHDGQYLAGAEVLGAYGLHSELLRQNDVGNLPLPDLGGLEYSVPGRGRFDQCPYIDQYGDEFCLNADEVYSDHHSWSAPTVLGGVEE